MPYLTLYHMEDLLAIYSSPACLATCHLELLRVVTISAKTSMMMSSADPERRRRSTQISCKNQLRNMQLLTLGTAPVRFFESLTTSSKISIYEQYKLHREKQTIASSYIHLLLLVVQFSSVQFSLLFQTATVRHRTKQSVKTIVLHCQIGIDSRT